MSKNFFIYNLGIGKYANKELTQPQLVLLCCLIHICKAYEKKFPSKEGRCFLNNTQLSKETGLSKSKIEGYLEELRKQGYTKEFDENNTRAIVVNMDCLNFIKGTTKGFYIPKDILTRKDLSISEKLIFGYMTSFGFKNKDVNVKNETLLNLLKIKSNKTISLAIKKFKDLGLIDVSYNLKGKSAGFLTKRNIKVNKEVAKNYIQNYIQNNIQNNIEINNINNIQNNSNNTINNDNRVINYYISLTKDEYEEFLKNRSIEDILGGDKP